MKMFLLRVSALLLCLSLSAAAQTLSNASFEEPAQEDDRANGWDRWGHWINRECAWTPVRDGRCLIGYHHWEIETAENSGLYQDVAGVKAGKRYTFRIHANADRAKDGQDPSSVELRLESTVDGQQVTVESRSFKIEDLAGGDEWSTLTVAGTAANDTLRVLVIVYPAAEGPRNGALRFDAAELTE